MKPSILIFAFSVFCSVALFGQQPQNQPQPAVATAAEWSGGPTKTSSLKDGQTEIVEKFEFKNIGDVPISIGTVATSCGCTAPSYTPTVIEPGATGYVELKYGTKKAGHGKTVRSRVMFSDGKVNDLIWTINNSPNPSDATSTPPKQAAPQFPTLEWGETDSPTKTIPISLNPGQKISKVTAGPQVSVSHTEKGAGIYDLIITRVESNPFWGSILIDLEPKGPLPIRVNLKAKGRMASDVSQ